MSLNEIKQNESVSNSNIKRVRLLPDTSLPDIRAGLVRLEYSAISARFKLPCFYQVGSSIF